jgi:DME family drug/metabolite transporter
VIVGLLLIALAATSWGTTGSVTTILAATAGAEPLLIGAARMVVAAAVLLAVVGVRRDTLAPAPGDGWRCLALGACMAAFQVTYFTAVTLAGIAVTALIAICSAPLFIVGLAVVVLGERPGRRVLVALAIGVLGTALLVIGPGPSRPSAPPGATGMLLALAAGLAYAVYVVLTKQGLAHTAPLALTTWTFTAAALFMLPLLAWTNRPLSQVAHGWPGLLYLGVVATAGAYALYSAGLRRVPASAAGVMTLLEPLTATALGVLVFGERLGSSGALGSALLLASLLMLMLGGSERGSVKKEVAPT